MPVNPIFPEFPIDPAAREHLSRLASGSVLLAKDALEDPNFSAAVVLICKYEKEDGAYGLVLNRPSHMPLSEIFDGFVDSIDRREVFIGGPVQQGDLQVIQLTDLPVLDSYEVAPRVHLGGDWKSIDAVLTLDPADVRLFLGYSGWAPGQLEMEISAGAWDVFRVDIEKLLLNKQNMLASDIKSISAYLDTLRLQP
jgi:putative transcriptional regulator